MLIVSCCFVSGFVSSVSFHLHPHVPKTAASEAELAPNKSVGIPSGKRIKISGYFNDVWLV